MAKKFEDTITTSKVGTWKYIAKTLFRDKKLVIGMIFTIILIATLDLAVPLLNSYSIRHFFESNDPNRYDNKTIMIVVYLALVPVYFCSIFLYKSLCEKMNARLAYGLRKDAYLNLQKLSFSYFDKNASGWIMARMTSDARNISDLISYGLIDGIWGALQMVGIFVILLFVNPLLSIVLLVICPFMFFLTRVICNRQLIRQREAKKINSEMTGLLSESFLGINATKTLGIEEQNKNIFKNKTTEFRKATVKSIRLGSLMGPIMFVLGYLCVSVILIFGGKMSIDQTKVFGNIITVSSLYLFVDYTIKFFDPVYAITGILNEFQNANASAERLVALINETPSIVEKEEVIEKYGTIFSPKKENYEKMIGDIEFKDVSFEYIKGEKILDDFNLKIKKGSSVGLVGYTGSGKSTIVNLICRFYEPTKGQILIDGVDYKDRSLGWLHSNLGYVLQTPQLFTGTIMDNIKYGKMDATFEEVKRACEIVNASEFIEKLPDKYDSFVGEGGSHLSMGERQLISFARAIISDPKIIVLDEATSSIDTKTETIIKDTIGKVLKDRTSFLIAHRLSTVVDCDIILVLDKGKVIESGTHQELLNMHGHYYELYRNQFQSDKIKTIIGLE